MWFWSAGKKEITDATLKKDKEVVLKAVATDGRALEYAADTLKKDIEYV